MYEDLDSILDVSGGWLYDDLLRSIGWGAIKFLVWLNDWIEGVVEEILSLGGLYNNPDMEEFINFMQPLAVAFLVISLVVVGFLFMLNKIEKRNEVVLNVLLSVGVIVVLPHLMSLLEDTLKLSLDYVDEGTLSDGILKRNIADVKYYVDTDFNYANGLVDDEVRGNEDLLPHPPHANSKDIGTTDYYYANRLAYPDTIDITEKLDVQSDSGWFTWTTEDWVNDLSQEGEDFLTHRYEATGYEDGMTVKEMKENSVPATQLGQQSYYRYHVNWAIAIAQLLVTAFALVITVVKIGRAMFDLAFHQIYAMFTASTDVTGGQRLKKVLVEIVNTFAVMFIMIVLLKLFTIYAQWVSDLETSIGIVGVVLMLIAGAWGLIDAPDVVQRTLGIDAGLRSGWQSMLGAYAGARMAGGAGKAVAKGSTAVAKGAWKSGKGIGNVGQKGFNKVTGKGNQGNNSLSNSSSIPNQKGGNNGNADKGFQMSSQGKNALNPNGASTGGSQTIPTPPNGSSPLRHQSGNNMKASPSGNIPQDKQASHYQNTSTGQQKTGQNYQSNQSTRHQTRQTPNATGQRQPQANRQHQSVPLKKNKAGEMTTRGGIIVPNTSSQSIPPKNSLDTHTGQSPSSSPTSTPAPKQTHQDKGTTMQGGQTHSSGQSIPPKSSLTTGGTSSKVIPKKLDRSPASGTQNSSPRTTNRQNLSRNNMNNREKKMTNLGNKESIRRKHEGVKKSDEIRNPKRD